MEYGSSVWGIKDAQKIDRVQHRAIRYFLGVHKFAPILGMLGDMGWHEAVIGRQLCMFRLWNRIMKMSQDRLTKNIFTEDFNCHVNRNNWSYSMLELFRNVDLEHVFWSKDCVDIANVECTLKEKAVDSWHQAIHRKPKLRTYVKFKNDFITENYVKYCFDRKGRSLTAQLRLGILPIKVETGRYTNIQIQDRLCEHCVNLVEDECHFILHCRQNRLGRQILFNKAAGMCHNFLQLDDSEKMSFLFNDMWKDMCSFVKESWVIRQNDLYVN
jgi:hypothetical protein